MPEFVENFSWIEVGGHLVSSVQLGPLGIGEAIELAAALGAELPTPALVDAIWRAADLRIEPLTVEWTANHAKRSAAELIARGEHDGTASTMATEAVYARQAERTLAAIDGRPHKLLAGQFKDVCLIDGKPGLYGWHRLDGRVRQPPFTGHGLFWKDYSQGLRLTKKIG